MNPTKLFLIVIAIILVCVLCVISIKSVDSYENAIVMKKDAPFYLQPEYNPSTKANLEFINILYHFGAFNKQK